MRIRGNIKKDDDVRYTYIYIYLLDEGIKAVIGTCYRSIKLTVCVGIISYLGFGKERASIYTLRSSLWVT